MRRLTPVPVLLAAVLAMGAGTAKAQETVNIAVKAIAAGIGPTAEKIIVTGAHGGSVWTFSRPCAAIVGFVGERSAPKLVVIDKTVPPTATIFSEAYFSEPVAPGTRLVNVRLISLCSDGGVSWRIYQCDIVSPRNLDLALVTTPAGVTLDDDNEAIVKSETDELGIAEVLVVRKGQKNIKTELLSDLALEMGDRLTDFLEVDDPVTGETIYACWLEY